MLTSSSVEDTVGSLIVLRDRSSDRTGDFPGAYSALTLYIINLTRRRWHHSVVLSMPLLLIKGTRGLWSVNSFYAVKLFRPVCLRLREQCLRSEITSVSRVAHVLLLPPNSGNMDVNSLASKCSELVGNAEIVRMRRVFNNNSTCVCLRLPVAAITQKRKNASFDLWPALGVMQCGGCSYLHSVFHVNVCQWLNEIIASQCATHLLVPRWECHSCEIVNITEATSDWVFLFWLLESYFCHLALIVVSTSCI